MCLSSRNRMRAQVEVWLELPLEMEFVVLRAKKEGLGEAKRTNGGS